MEMSYFGARVIHPYTMVPVVEQAIPILIKNTLRPEQPGSRISEQPSGGGRAITGIASVDSIALINVEGGGMLGARGMAARVLGALARASVNVMMISQASSEHSICLVLDAAEAEGALAALQTRAGAGAGDQAHRHLRPAPRSGCRRHHRREHARTPGIAGKLFAALGGAGINVQAIAQGSSERNISLVVSAADESRALQVIHRAFLSG